MQKRGIILSALSLAVAVMLLGYSAYGWMSMSRSVRAVAQNVTVSVPDNLLISASESGPWSDSVTVELSDIVRELTKNDDNKYTSGKFYLLPASTYDGTEGTLWQTGSAKNDGSAAAGAVFEKGRRIKWNQSTTSFEGHWIDVPLYFKTDSESSVGVALSKGATSIVPVSADADIVKTVRAAFLSADRTAPSTGTEPLVLCDEFSNGVFEGKVIKNASQKIEPKYLTYTDGLSTELFTVAPGDTPTCIVVRIWVEGQDISCVAKIGGQTFSLSLGFSSID